LTIDDCGKKPARAIVNRKSAIVNAQ